MRVGRKLIAKLSTWLEWAFSQTAVSPCSGASLTLSISGSISRVMAIATASGKNTTRSIGCVRSCLSGAALEWWPGVVMRCIQATLSTSFVAR